MVLSVTGSIYLFKPQIHAYLEKDLMALQFSGKALPISDQIVQAMQQLPGATLTLT